MRRSSATLTSAALVLIVALAAVTASCEDLTVVPVEPRSITVEPADARLQLGEQLEFSAILRDASGNRLSGRTIEWSSTNPSVARVDATGLVEAVAPGTTRIEGRTGEISGFALMEVEAPPSMEVTPASLDLAGTQGEEEPQNATVEIRNVGGGRLVGLTATVIPDPDASTREDERDPTRWLSAALNGADAPTTLDVSASAAHLAEGVYRALILLESRESAGTGPGTGVPSDSVILPVTFRVAAPPPRLSVVPGTLGFAAEEGEPAPPAQIARITNLGGGSLTGIEVEIGFPSPPPRPWLSASLSTSTAPSELRVEVDTRDLTQGVFEGWVDVATSATEVDPVRVPVTLVVGGEPPRISLGSDSVEFETRQSGPDPDPAVVAIANPGTGDLGNITSTVRYTSGPAQNWLSTILSARNAPTALELRVTGQDLAVGSYTASIEIASPDAVNSPVFLPVTLEVLPAPSAEASILSASPSQIPADGESTSAVIVELRDASGALVDMTGVPVSMETSLGVLQGAGNAGSTVTALDLGQGRYGATLRASTEPGLALLSATVRGAAVGNTAQVEFAPVEVVPPSLQVVSGDAQTGTVGEALAEPLVVRVLDSGGDPVAGVSLVAALTTVPDSADGTVLDPLDPVSDDDGLARVTLTLGDTPGTYAVELRFPGDDPGAGVSFEASGQAADADPATSTLAVDDAELDADGSASTTVTVTLQDRFGNALDRGGDLVRVTTSAGSLSGGQDGASASAGSPVQANDLGDGRYTLTLVAPLEPGEATLSATLGDDSADILVDQATVTFVAVPDPDPDPEPDPEPAALEAVSGDAQTSTVGEALAEPLVVRVLDSGGDPVAGVSLVAALTTVPDGADGTALDLLDPVSDEDGLARVTLTLGDTPGTYAVELRLPGDDPDAGVSFQAAALAADADPATSTLAVDDAELDADGSASTTVTVTLQDRFGNALDRGGDLVRVTTSAGSLSGGQDGASASAGSPVQANDLGDGRYTLTLVAPLEPGEATLSATLGDDPADILVDQATVTFVAVPDPDPDPDPDPEPDPEPATLEVVSGGAQTGTVGEALAEPLVVRVLDSGGDPVAGVSLVAALTAVPDGADGTTLDPLDPVSDTDGFARVALTLGDTPGTYAVELRFPGDDPDAGVSFQAAALAADADPAASTLAVDDAELDADGSASTTVTVTLQDRFGNSIGRGGDLVRVTTSAGSLSGGQDGASASAGSPVQANDLGDGRYTLTLVAPLEPGEATLSATLGDDPADPLADQATVTFVAVPDPDPDPDPDPEPDPDPDPEPATLEVVSGGAQTGTVGEALAEPLVVRVLDSGGDPVSGVSLVAALTAVPEGSDGTALDPLDPVSDTDGFARVALTLGDTPGTYAVELRFPGDDPGAGVSFQAAALAGEPTATAFISQPQDVQVDEPFDPIVAVEIQDAFGNRVDTFSGEVEIFLQEDGSEEQNSSLSGAVVVAVEGLASFPELRVDSVGDGFVLRAEAEDMESALSDPFSVTPPPGEDNGESAG